MKTSSPNHWLQVSFEGQTSNRDGVGARVGIVAKGVSQIQENTADEVIRVITANVCTPFGLGMAEEIESLTVQWPSGQRDKFLKAQDRHILVREGSQTLKVVQVESQR